MLLEGGLLPLGVREVETIDRGLVGRGGDDPGDEPLELLHDVLLG